MAADDLTTQGVRASAAMVLTSFHMHEGVTGNLYHG